MVDITDLPEIQEEIRMAIVKADIQAVKGLDEMESPKGDDVGLRHLFTQEEE
jgi:hypothetical protein